MLNVLNSHAYTEAHWERIILDKHPQVRFLMDSGAFSCFMSKAVVKAMKPEFVNPDMTLSIDGYMRRVEKLKGGLWQYIMLDVVQNEKASLANLDTMVTNGFKPMPVLTSDAPISHVKDFVKINPHVCLAGGTVDALGYYSARMEEAWRVSGKKARLHGLGFTRYASVRTRAWSVDSSSWLQGARFGNVSIFDQMRGGLYTYSTASRKMNTKIMGLLSTTGAITQKGLKKRSGSFSQVNVLSTYSWLEYAKWARPRGLEFFFAVASPRDFTLLIAVATSIRPDKSIDFDWICQARDECGNVKYPDIVKRMLDEREPCM